MVYQLADMAGDSPLDQDGSLDKAFAEAKGEDPVELASEKDLLTHASSEPAFTSFGLVFRKFPLGFSWTIGAFRACL